MMTEAVSVMTSPSNAFYGSVRYAVGVLRTSVLVDVLHDLGLARARAERLAEGLGGQIPGGVEVGARLGAAERARGGQAGLHPSVGRIAVGVGRVDDLFDLAARPPAGL